MDNTCNREWDHHAIPNEWGISSGSLLLGEIMLSKAKTVCQSNVFVNLNMKSFAVGHLHHFMLKPRARVIKQLHCSIWIHEGHMNKIWGCWIWNNLHHHFLLFWSSNGMKQWRWYGHRSKNYLSVEVELDSRKVLLLTMDVGRFSNLMTSSRSRRISYGEFICLVRL